MEDIEQIVNCWTVGGYVRIVCFGLRVRVIVTAAAGDGLETPVSLDELNDRNMVAIAVVHVAARGERRDDDQRDTGSVTEEIERLNVAGIVVSTAFVEGDEHCRARPKSRVSLQLVYDVLHEAFEQIQFRGRRMAVGEPARFDDRNRG